MLTLCISQNIPYLFKGGAKRVTFYLYTIRSFVLMINGMKGHFNSPSFT